MSARTLAVPVVLVASAVACGGASDVGEDFKPLWPTYAETAPAGRTAPGAPVAEPSTGASDETAPPPLVLLLPSLSCAVCYGATVRVLEEHPEGLRRHEIDVASGEVRLYPEHDSYRPDTIVAALRQAGYIARIKNDSGP